MGRTEPVDV